MKITDAQWLVIFGFMMGILFGGFISAVMDSMGGLLTMKRYTGLIRKDTLKTCFEKAKETGAAYIGIVIKRKDSAGVEIIINPACNFDDKLAYYLAAYDDTLTLKTAPEISIVSFGYGDTFAELGRLLK